jgi:hypothetical protein
LRIENEEDVFSILNSQFSIWLWRRQRKKHPGYGRSIFQCVRVLHVGAPMQSAGCSAWCAMPMGMWQLIQPANVLGAARIFATIQPVGSRH